MTQELVERFEKQRDAYQALVERSLDAYMDLAYAPFSYYKEGLQAAKKAGQLANHNVRRREGRAYGAASLPSARPGGRQRLRVDCPELHVLLLPRGNLDGAQKRANQKRANG